MRGHVMARWCFDARKFGGGVCFAVGISLLFSFMDTFTSEHPWSGTGRCVLVIFEFALLVDTRDVDGHTQKSISA